MSRTGRFLPAFVALVGLGGGLAAALQMQLAGDAIPAAPAFPPGDAVAAEPVVVEDRTDAQLAAILARPLFDARRRPPPAGSTAPSVGLPRLTGVMVGSFGRSAIFAALPGGKPLVLQEGERIEAHVVQAIHPGEVVLLGPEGRRVLHPAFDASGQSAPDLMLPPGHAETMPGRASPELRAGR